jgi:hypothetical protein
MLSVAETGTGGTGLACALELVVAVETTLVLLLVAAMELVSVGVVPERGHTLALTTSWPSINLPLSDPQM